MGSDSGNLSQASAGRGLSRSSSKMNLAGAGGLGRSSSKLSLAGMAGGASKLGLRRSPSRAQLNPSLVDGDAAGTGAAPSLPTAPTNAPTDTSEPATGTPAPAKSVPASTPVAARPPVLKRSHSMDHIDAAKAPEISEGQKAVESISGKVALPSVSIRPIPGSKAPAGVAEKDISERGRVVQERKPAEQASAPGADLARSSAPSSSFPSPGLNVAGAAGTAPTTEGPELTPAVSPKSSATSLVPPKLPSNLNLPSPRDDAAALPEADQRVDYFSHDWNESDIAGSWRYIISRRQDMANSARLENASWRMWAKAKNGLATVPPSTVNWLKDYDVTWLYGPLYHEPDSVYNGSPAEQSSRGGSVSPETDFHANVEHTPATSKHGCYPKSILKKKTLAQLMLEDAHELEHNAAAPSSHARSTANYLRHHHYRPVPQGVNRQMVADILNQQYASVPSHEGPVATPGISEPPSGSGSEAGSRSSTPGSRRPLSIRSLRSNRSGSLASLSTLERHVHFNDRVEQCIALDPEAEEAKSQSRPETLGSEQSSEKDGKAVYDEDEEDDEDEDDEDEEDNAGLFLGLRRPSVLDIKAHDSGCNIIASLPATTLKYEDEDAEDSANRSKDELVTSMLSSRRPGFNAHYQPHPVQTQHAPSYEIVDPTVHPVDFKADSNNTELGEEKRQKIRPAASFG